jgi:hypothetical protein
VSIEAYLYADQSAFEAKTPLVSGSGLGHFKLLSGGGWDSDAVSTQINNMTTNGETSGSFSATVKPINLLVQTASDSGVGYIEIRKVTLKLNAGLPTLDKAFDKGSFMTVSGNKITFNNATNSDAAASYKFSTDQLSNIGSKTVTVNYTVQGYSDDPTVEQQLCVQAAGDGDGQVNDGGSAQWYPVLTTPSGTFTMEGSLLLSRASDKGFTLTNFRMVNNGGNDNEETGNTRQKSYVLFITSVTVN